MEVKGYSPSWEGLVVEGDPLDRMIAQVDQEKQEIQLESLKRIVQFSLQLGEAIGRKKVQQDVLKCENQKLIEEIKQLRLVYEKEWEAVLDRSLLKRKELALKIETLLDSILNLPKGPEKVVFSVELMKMFKELPPVFPIKKETAIITHLVYLIIRELPRKVNDQSWESAKKYPRYEDIREHPIIREYREKIEKDTGSQESQREIVPLSNALAVRQMDDRIHKLAGKSIIEYETLEKQMVPLNTTHHALVMKKKLMSYYHRLLIIYPSIIERMKLQKPLDQAKLTYSHIHWDACTERSEACNRELKVVQKALNELISMLEEYFKPQK